MIKYGIVLMRAQPLHKGHQHIIDKIIADGLEPIVLLGSANKSDKKNPYHPLQRIEMVKLVYPDIRVWTIDDYTNWDEWFRHLLSTLKLCVTKNLAEVTIYLHEKLEDLQNFTFRGLDYTEESYCKLYEVAGINTTKLPISDIQIRAKSIREELEKNKHYLHIEVYKYIKGLNNE
ncbi:MAG: hypothetical protein DRG30_08620 [Epsilonproteobacteria bacterium]|nr:MAG: hypothetical protein DRG30_08620 [Campylobacterota bacterium]